MKQLKINILLALVALVGLTSCLKKADSNVDIEDLTTPIVTLQFIENGSGTTINSGMQYFGGGALTYPGTDESDTATYNISIAGPSPLTKDIAVTVGIDNTKLLDNYSSDSIKYDAMPDSVFKFIGTSGTIKAGSRVIPMKIVFYPSKMDVTKSYMLPVVVKDASGTVISSNFGVIYFHVIGNPIAGAYSWNYYRWNNNTMAGAPTGWEDDETTFVPINPTTIKVITGYYTQIDYNITFKNNNGVLSDFEVAFDKEQYDDSFVANGVTLTSGPELSYISPDNKEFEVRYIVYNGSAYRYIIDQFIKK
jgi:hypothetical protein